MKKVLKKINGGWIFLIVVLILYLFLFLFDSALIKEVLIELINLLKKVVPVLVLVFILIFFSNIFFNPKRIIKFIGKNAGIKGWVISIVGGMLSAGPIYIWYPLLSDLQKKGMRYSFIAAFLYNRAVKIPLVPMMIYYFGLPFTVILTIYMIIFSVLNGFLVEKILKLELKS